MPNRWIVRFAIFMVTMAIISALFRPQKVQEELNAYNPARNFSYAIADAVEEGDAICGCNSHRKNNL